MNRTIILVDIGRDVDHTIEIPGNELPTTYGALKGIVRKMGVELKKVMLTDLYTRVSYLDDKASLSSLFDVKTVPTLVMAPLVEPKGGVIDYSACPLPGNDVIVDAEKGNGTEMAHLLRRVRDWAANAGDEKLQSIAYYAPHMKKSEVAASLKAAIDYVESRLTTVEEASTDGINPQLIDDIFDYLDKIDGRITTSIDSLKADIDALAQQDGDTATIEGLRKRIIDLEVEVGIINEESRPVHLQRYQEAIQELGNLSVTVKR